MWAVYTIILTCPCGRQVWLRRWAGEMSLFEKYGTMERAASLYVAVCVYIRTSPEFCAFSIYEYLFRKGVIQNCIARDFHSTMILKRHLLSKRFVQIARNFQKRNI